MPTAKTAAERKAAERLRRKAEGLVWIGFWIRPSEVGRVKKYIERIGADIAPPQPRKRSSK